MATQNAQVKRLDDPFGAFVVDGFFLCTFCCRRVTVVPESKAPDAIATPCGTVIDVREEHPLKAR